MMNTLPFNPMTQTSSAVIPLGQIHNKQHELWLSSVVNIAEEVHRVGVNTEAVLHWRVASHFHVCHMCGKLGYWAADGEVGE